MSNTYIIQRRVANGTTGSEEIGSSDNFEAAILMFGEALKHYPAVRLIDRYQFIGDPQDTVLSSWRWDDL